MSCKLLVNFRNPNILTLVRTGLLVGIVEIIEGAEVREMNGFFQQLKRCSGQ